MRIFLIVAAITVFSFNSVRAGPVQRLAENIKERREARQEAREGRNAPKYETPVRSLVLPFAADGLRQVANYVEQPKLIFGCPNGKCPNR